MSKYIAHLFKELSKIKRKMQFFPRVRDWKGYGVWNKCGTCEPLQSPTAVALERWICRTMEGTPKFFTSKSRNLYEICIFPAKYPNKNAPSSQTELRQAAE